MTNSTGPDGEPSSAEGTSTMHDDQAQARTELGQLADALIRHGCHATVITPAPYLALHLPGVTAPYMIYSSGGHYWWHVPQDIAPAGQTIRAAELITWGLRNLTHHDPPPTHDTTSAHPAALGPFRCVGLPLPAARSRS